jgi:hypothetical protein
MKATIVVAIILWILFAVAILNGNFVNAHQNEK